MTANIRIAGDARSLTAAQKTELARSLKEVGFAHAQINTTNQGLTLELRGPSLEVTSIEEERSATAR